MDSKTRKTDSPYRTPKSLCIALCILFLPAAVFGFETQDFQIHLTVANMEKARPPLLMEDSIILSYQTEGPVRFVGAAFSHEQFSRIHPFMRNSHDVFILVYPLPEDETELSYRFVVDGLWLADPLNADTQPDASGIVLSRMNLPKKELNRWKLETPVIHEDNTVDFYYFGPPNLDIYITGTFNNWDPYFHKMKETKAGEYALTLTIVPGRHFYTFVYNGLFFLDPLNPGKGSDSEGNQVSMFEISRPALSENGGGIKLFGIFK